jgi:uncharacterized membrane protein
MPNKSIPCQICKQEKRMRDLVPAEVLRPSLVHFIEGRQVDWSPTGFICLSDLNRFRTEYVKEVIETEVGEISALENEVLASLRERELLSTNIYSDLDAKETFGQRLSDRIAAFGGSWKFIIVFFALLLGWIITNSLLLVSRAFDPYPFILLNLVLSTLAAVQAPMILMSQNRMETRDRLRSENDYKINLKAELEIRHLHEKIDHLVKQQWQRLVEIQQIQLELMEELSERKRR